MALSPTSVDAKNEAASFRKSNHAAGRKKMKFGGQLRSFPACDLDAMRLLFARMIIGLPLRDPVRAHPRAIRLHLLTQHIQLAFQSFGAPIELELRKALGQDGLNVVQRMRLE